MDFGCPQATDPSLLKNYITEAAFCDNLEEINKKKTLTQLTRQITGVLYYRPEGIVYSKNEIMLDIV